MPARVRWGNVGRAAAAVGLVALVVAWPRLGGAAPALPADDAVPVASAPEAPAVERWRAAGAGAGAGAARAGAGAPANGAGEGAGCEA